MQLTNSPHDYAGAMGAAAVRSGTAEWRVRVDLGHGSYPHNVFVGVAKAGVALSTCSTGYLLNQDHCRGYSAFWCRGRVEHALDSPATRYVEYSGFPQCSTGDVVTVRLDADRGTLAYLLNGKLLKTLTAGVKGKALALVAST